MPDRATYMRVGQTKGFQPVFIELFLAYEKKPVCPWPSQQAAVETEKSYY